MIIKHPEKQDLPRLIQLWKEAFGENEEEFFRLFLKTAYSSKRCLAAFESEELCSALYWFDCDLDGNKIAYMYGVATFEKFRGKGICRSVMEKAKEILKKRGYQGIVLVPAKPSLFSFYEKMGFQIRTTLDEFSAVQGEEEIPLKKISGRKYAYLRRKAIPKGGVLQEKENLKFLKTQFLFYAGDGFLAAVRKEGETLFCGELLGDKSVAPKLLKTLGFKQGKFRTVGNNRDYAVFCPIEQIQPPLYFAFAFD